MAALLFKGKKGVNHSYASPASTATSTSLEHLLSVDLQSTGELDRRAPRLRAQQQALGWVPPSLSKNKTHLQTSRRSWGRPGDPASPTASTRFLLDDDEADAFFDVFQELDSLPAWIPIDPDRFRSATGDDSAALKPSSSSSSSSSTITTTTAAAAAAAAAKERDQVLFGASSSSSYLPLSRLIQIEKGDGSPVLRPSTAAPPPATLQTPKGGDSAAFEQSPFARSRKQAFFEASSSSSLQDRLHSVQDDNSTALKPSSSCSSSARSQDQVVVLKVSLHCKGCETKVRKHISRMKGVTSFDIDYATKKVTVIGDVTPLGVLSSVSKVKSAHFWPSLAQESTSSP